MTGAARKSALIFGSAQYSLTRNILVSTTVGRQFFLFFHFCIFRAGRRSDRGEQVSLTIIFRRKEKKITSACFSFDVRRVCLIHGNARARRYIVITDVEANRQSQQTTLRSVIVAVGQGQVRNRPSVRRILTFGPFKFTDRNTNKCI